MTFGKRLKTLRNEKGLELKDLAEEFNKSKSTFSAYENDRRKPDINLVKEIANFFDVSTDYLLCNTNIRVDINKKIKEAIEDDPDLYSFWDKLSKRDDLQLLFKQTRNLSPEAIKSVVEFMKAIENEHQNNN